MDEKLPKRELTTAPGFPCPQCGMCIKLSLPVFLGATEVTCPGCGLLFQMDKSQCGWMLELLQEIQTADENVQMLSKRRL